MSTPTPDVEKEKKSTNSPYLANAWNVFAFGLTTVIGGQYYGWTAGYDSGVGILAIAQGLVSVAFLCYVMCLAEMVSAMPLKGGTFAVGRVCLGFYGGYLVGALMLTECVLMTSMSASFIGFAYNSIHDSMYWIICILFYVVSAVVVGLGGRVFWYFNYFLAIVSTIILFIYIFGVLKYANFDRYAKYDPTVLTDDTFKAQSMDPNAHGNTPWFLGGFYRLFLNLTLSSSVYAGIEILALMPSRMKNPKVDLPKAILGSMTVILITNTILIFIFPSLPPGVVFTSLIDYPMNWGLRHIFHTTDDVAIGLIMPAQFAMGFGFIPAGTQLLVSFGEANLLPPITKSHTASVIIFCTVSFLFALISYFNSLFYDHITNVAVLAALASYFNQLIGYIMFQGRYSSIDRTFHSPLGIYGAIYAILIFIGVAISSIFFQGDSGFSIVFIIIVSILASIYYYSGPNKTQVITDEEFRMNVINANYRRANGTLTTRIAKFLGISDETLVQLGLKKEKDKLYGSQKEGIFDQMASTFTSAARRSSAMFVRTRAPEEIQKKLDELNQRSQSESQPKSHISGSACEVHVGDELNKDGSHNTHISGSKKSNVHFETEHKEDPAFPSPHKNTATSSPDSYMNILPTASGSESSTKNTESSRKTYLFPYSNMMKMFSSRKIQPSPTY